MTIFGYRIIKQSELDRLAVQKAVYEARVLERLIYDTRERLKKQKQAKYQKRDKYGRFVKEIK